MNRPTRMELADEMLRLRLRLAELEGALVSSDAPHDAWSSREATSEFDDDYQSRAERLLDESRRRLQAVVDSAPVVLWAIDRFGVFTLSEGRGLAALGLKPGEVVGNSVFHFYADQVDVLTRILRALSGEEFTTTVEVGGRVYETHYCPQHDANGQVTGVIGVSTDLTERARAERALRQARDEFETRVDERTRDLTAANAELERQVAETRRVERSLSEQARLLQQILDSIGDGVVVADETGRFTQFNPAAARILGIGPLASPPERWSADYGLFEPDQVTPCAVDDLPLVRALRGEDVVGRVLFVRNAKTPGGVWLSVTATPLVGDDGRTRGGVAAFRDMSEQHKSDKRHESEEKALRCLVEGYERHQKLTAYEIHDGLAQEINAAHLAAEVLSMSLDGRDAAIAESLEQLKSLLRGAMSEARQLIAGLRPPAIDAQGVVAAVDELVHSSTRCAGIDVEFIHPRELRRLAPLVETTIFRIVQEALTNVQKHSGSPRARVTLAERGERIQLEILDFGTGFDAENVASNCYGLQGIRERARLLGGSASVASTPTGGTRVFVELPALPAVGQD